MFSKKELGRGRGAAHRTGAAFGERAKRAHLGNRSSHFTMYEAWVAGVKRAGKSEVREAVVVRKHSVYMNIGDGLRAWIKVQAPPPPPPVGYDTYKRQSDQAEGEVLRDTKLLKRCSRWSCPKRCSGRGMFLSCPPKEVKGEEGGRASRKAQVKVEREQVCTGLSGETGLLVFEGLEKTEKFGKR